MMRTGPWALGLLCVCTLGLCAELPPILPEVWNIQESDTKGSGALILERTLRFRAQSIEHFYVIRVLSERGKAAVEFPGFSPSAKIEGRTITRQGSETPFKASADFQTKPLVETDYGDLNRKAVIPPGLTTDCVVQIRWTEPTYLGALGGYLDYRIQDQVYPLASRLPTRRMMMEVDASVGWAYDLQTGARGAQIGGTGGSRTATFIDLPAYEWVPFSEDSAKDNPKFVIYQQPRYLMEEAAKGQTAYWNRVANQWWRPFFEGKCTYGRAWGDFSEDMRRNLPSSRQEAAVEIHRRLIARIKDVNALLPEEAALRSTAQRTKQADFRDFAETLKSGETTRDGVYLLFWILLRQANISVKPVRVVDREIRKLRMKQCNLGQFDHTLYLIEEPGKLPLYLDPGRRYADPALIHPKYQGTEALALVPSEPWGFQVVRLPFQDGVMNTRTTRIQIDASGERDRIQMTSAFAGMAAWTERGEWWPLPPGERHRGLKEVLAKIDSAVQVERATVGAISMSPFSWTAEATRERESDRYLEIHPFPMMKPPVFLPKDLPAERKEPIVMRQIGSSEVETAIKVPAGYLFSNPAPFQMANTLGEVSWVATPSEGRGPAEVLVRYRVSTKMLISESSAYPQLKAFLSWVRESFGRTVVLTRSSS